MTAPRPPSVAAGESPAAPARANRDTARRVVPLFRPYRAQVAAVVALILVTSTIGIINPLLIQVVFNDALFVKGGPNIQLLVILVAIMAVIPIINGAIGILQVYETTRVGQLVMRDLRDRLYSHLQTLPLSFFTGTKTGEIQSRLANDVGGVQSVVTTTASTILANVVIFTSTIVAMVILSWQLTIVAVITVPVFFWLTKTVGERRRQVARSTQESLAAMSALSEETLSVSGVLLAKVFGNQVRDTARYHQENQRLAGLEVRQQMIGQGFFAVVQSFLSITPAAVYLIAGLLLAHGSAISAGTVVAFTTLQTRLYFPIGQLLQVSVELRSSLALFDRIFEYLDVVPEDPVEQGQGRSQFHRDLQQLPDREVQAGLQRGERYDGARRDGRAVRQQEARDQVDRGRGDGQERLHDGVEALADHLLADFQVGQALVLLVVTGSVARLVAEGLRQQHPGHRQGFLGQGAHRRQRLLGRSRHLAAPLADRLGQPEEHGHGDERHDGQLPAKDHHGHDGGGEDDDVGQDGRGGGGDHRLDTAHVVGQPGLNLAGPGPGEERERERLQVRIQPVTQVPHDLLPDPGGLVGLQDADGAVDDRYDAHDGDQDDQQLEVRAAGDEQRLVEHRLDQQRVDDA